MKMSITISRFALATALLFFTIGCSSYAKLVRSDEANDRLNIRTLEKNWEAYTIYYTDTGGAHYGNVALLFDPKDDDRTLVAHRWTQIEDKKTLSSIIDNMDQRGYRPGMYNIVGTNGNDYGYLYAAKRWLITKVESDTTMHVYDFPPRPSAP
jgi:hypothetical protein